jgi:putative ABC transport system substrate-binding protein
LIEFAVTSTDWGSAFSNLVPGSRRPDAVYLVPDSFVYDQGDRITALALGQRIPTFGTGQEAAYDGALFCYGPSVPDLHRRSAYYVKRIIEGANPADLPVEQATRIGIAINLRSARAIGVDVPEQLLARADDVIE